MSNLPWTGVFPAAITHLHSDQSLDLPATARHLEALIESGVSALIVCGSLGENQMPAARRKTRRGETRHRSGRRSRARVCGVAEMSTQAAISYLQDCEKLGAAGFMIMPPMVYKT
jgi:1-pyrroline-4-hydroxy-2-carboxylate deaminase